jgi:hypothetical protein
LGLLSYLSIIITGLHPELMMSPRWGFPAKFKIQNLVFDIQFSSFRICKSQPIDVAPLGLNQVIDFDSRALRTRLMIPPRWGFPAKFKIQNLVFDIQFSSFKIKNSNQLIAPLQGFYSFRQLLS